MEMNGLYIVIASACILILAYRYYGAFLAAKVLVLDQFRPTPAVVHNDGHDYVPTNKWVTFGHHLQRLPVQVLWLVLLLLLNSVIYRVYYGS